MGVARLLWRLGVLARPARALGERFSVALVGGGLGREGLDEHDLGVTCRNLG
jgi:hypothetical protein